MNWIFIHQSIVHYFSVMWITSTPLPVQVPNLTVVCRFWLCYNNHVCMTFFYSKKLLVVLQYNHDSLRIWYNNSRGIKVLDPFFKPQGHSTEPPFLSFLQTRQHDALSILCWKFQSACIKLISPNQYLQQIYAFMYNLSPYCSIL